MPHVRSPERLDSRRTALLVIDLQNCTTGDRSTNEYYRMNSEELIGRVNSIIMAADMHKLQVIYIRSETSNPFINILNNSMAKGSFSADLDERLFVTTKYIVSKDRKDAFCNPILDSILLRHEVNKLYITGLDAAHCVNSTILGAQNRDYEIIVLSDAVISKSDEMLDQMLEEYKSRGLILKSTNEFLSQFENKTK